MARKTKKQIEADRLAVFAEAVGASAAVDANKEEGATLAQTFNVTVNTMFKAGLRSAMIRPAKRGSATSSKQEAGPLFTKCLDIVVRTYPEEEQTAFFHANDKSAKSPYANILRKATNRIARLTDALEKRENPPAKENEVSKAVRVHLDAIRKQVTKLEKLKDGTADCPTATLVEPATALHKTLVAYFDTATKTLPKA